MPSETAIGNRSRSEAGPGYTYGESLQGMGAERCNRSRTPGQGLGACQKLRPRKEAGDKIVVSHGYALPYGMLWKGAPLMWLPRYHTVLGVSSVFVDPAEIPTSRLDAHCELILGQDVLTCADAW